MHLHHDETYRPEYTWCPECGANACIITWNTTIGERYRCSYCGIFGRFGDGVSEPKLEQPPLETDYNVVD